MNRKLFTVFLDPGHGYDTPGKRSPVFDDGFQLLEWEWTRKLATYVGFKLNEAGVSTRDLVPEKRDICLQSRCSRANRFMTTRPNSILVSLHGNAAGHVSANGFEVFTSPGITESDKAAKFILDSAAETGVFKMRYDTTHPYLNKEARFKILTGTKYNAVLVEAGFYTNEREARYMDSIEGLNVISSIIASGIVNYIDSI